MAVNLSNDIVQNSLEFICMLEMFERIGVEKSYHILSRATWVIPVEAPKNRWIEGCVGEVSCGDRDSTGNFKRGLSC